MDDVLKRKLTDYAVNRLDDAECLTDDEAREKAHKEAMESVERINETERIESSVKTKHEKVMDTIKGVVIPIATPVIGGLVTFFVNGGLVKTLAFFEDKTIFSGKKSGIIGALWRK